VWPLCNAGLAQGSASKFSRESCRSRRDLGGEVGTSLGASGGGLLSRCGGDACSKLSETLVLLSVLRIGSDGSGRPNTGQ
jgi:hypothetical protein